VARLETVYETDDFQLTGAAVSQQGRIFVNFPLWSDRYLYGVVEVHEGGSSPFPDERWNAWDRKAHSAPEHFVCVQSVYVDTSDRLWVLDPAAPMLGPVVPGGPKLVEIDLENNEVARVIAFDEQAAPGDSYLNDVRIDLERKTAYITDSGRGGIVVVDLSDGSAHRALDGHPSVLAQQGMKITVNGRELLQYGKPPQFKSDSIALSPDGAYLYYKAIVSDTLYRIETGALRDRSAASHAGSAVEAFAACPPTDGIWMDDRERVYLSSVEHNAVSRMNPDGYLEQLVSDERLQWPDTFAQGPDGAMYITASHINEAPQFNNGKSVRQTPYGLYKLEL
jgi:sugar lactone lactonase YvrE